MEKKIKHLTRYLVLKANISSFELKVSWLVILDRKKIIYWKDFMISSNSTKKDSLE